ncbi:MAG: tryptophan--tRNA ligase, partial [Actinobacteria bacterium]|nr:tryptophan--tRNA ligase [Actinomycetota bacterium]
ADPASLAADFNRYGDLKVATADAVVALIEPIQTRRAELLADPAELQRQVAIGADKAQELATVVVARAKQAIGLLAR